MGEFGLNSDCRIILASASPRREELLRSMGLRFEVVPSRVDETTEPIPPDELVVTLARRKAAAVAAGAQVDGRTLVIGADTVVALEDTILGKPADAEDARRMLKRLSGREHRVLTGLALVLLGVGREHWAAGYEETTVRFAPLSAAEISRYVQTGEPMDKAGAYGIQGAAARFVEGITGCYSNVVGLPLRRLVVLAQEVGVGL